MTRNECEQKILELLAEIEHVCNQYKPDMLVSMSVHNGNRSVFSLERDGKYLLNALRFADGREIYEFERL